MRQPALGRAVNPALTTLFLTVPLTKTTIGEGDCFKAMMKGSGGNKLRGVEEKGWTKNGSGEEGQKSPA